MELFRLNEADRGLFLRLAYDREVMEMNYGRVFREEEAELVFQAMLRLNAAEEGLGYYRAVVPGEEGGAIGLGGLTWDEEQERAEIEYMLLPQFWGRGYGTELVGRLLRLAEELGRDEEIAAITAPENIRSSRILLRYGFVPVERFRNEEGALAERYLRCRGARPER